MFGLARHGAGQAVLRREACRSRRRVCDARVPRGRRGRGRAARIFVVVGCNWFRHGCRTTATRRSASVRRTGGTADDVEDEGKRLRGSSGSLGDAHGAATIRTEVATRVRPSASSIGGLPWGYAIRLTKPRVQTEQPFRPHHQMTPSLLSLRRAAGPAFPQDCTSAIPTSACSRLAPVSSIGETVRQTTAFCNVTRTSSTP